MHMRPGPAASDTSSTLDETNRSLARPAEWRSLSQESTVIVSVGPPETWPSASMLTTLPTRMRGAGNWVSDDQREP